MDLKIITDTENMLFNRREIEGDIHADSAPSRQDVKKIVSEKFSVKPEVVKIKTIKGKFGEKIFLVVANIYKSKEDMDKVELKKKKDTASPEVASLGETEQNKKEKPDVAETQPQENSDEKQTSPEEKQPEIKENPTDEEKTS